MSTVWWARHDLLGRDVALKLLPAADDDVELTCRFLREAQIIGQFHHRNIVSVLDAGELPEEGYHFLAMELLHGVPFADRLIPGEPLHATYVIPILIEVCRGLEVAHAAGVVHRDIKPENIFLAHVPGEGVVPKIVDFGISKLADARNGAKITADGQILGTPAYMSPEQALGRSDITPTVDIWAMGVILYEALAGQQPFTGANHVAVLEAIIDRQPPELPEWVDARTRAIVARCLQKDPVHRYPDAISLRIDLERALEEIVERCQRPTERTERPSRPPPPPPTAEGATIVPPSVRINAAAPISVRVHSSSAPPPSVRDDAPTLPAPPRLYQAQPHRKTPIYIAVISAAVCLGAIIASPAHNDTPVRLEASIGRIALRVAARLEIAVPEKRHRAIDPTPERDPKPSREQWRRPPTNPATVPEKNR